MNKIDIDNIEKKIARDVSFYLASRIHNLRQKGETGENIKLFTDSFLSDYDDTLKNIVSFKIDDKVNS